ncbi:MAG: NAD(P)H-hydrate dehydratase, partial [Epsilonproteobacteria bacterium]|nr:NAD(P)H-hydrate dehydratase [Campylobacterota bacterium]
MQKVFLECNSLDKRCYDEYGLSEDILQEHAACGMESYIRENFSKHSSVLVVVGSGNNGADGIALARLLAGDYDVRLYLHSEPASDMAKLQLKRAKTVGIKVAKELEHADVIVDAVFGSGLKRELDVGTMDLINSLNSLSGVKISCDIPTGIDTNGNIKNIAFKADITFAMGALKKSYFLDSVKDFIGKIIVVTLGVSHKLYNGETDMFALEEGDMVLPSRKAQSTHKGTFGHVAILCGEKEGAAIISAKAAMRFGAGLATLVIQDKVYTPYYLMQSTSLPINTTAIAVGMGLGTFFEESFLEKHIVSNLLPIVIDADALYSKKLLSILSQRRKIVVTPHPKEFISMWRILSGENITIDELQENRFEYVKKFSLKFPNVVLLLKGANTIISYRDEIYINSLGSSKLSKGGSGDVLSGLIASLLAQGYDALQAALQGSLALAIASQNFRGSSYAMLP